MNFIQSRRTLAANGMRAIDRKISPEQKDAVDRTLEHYKNGNRYVILLAQPQSGKTDTYLHVAFNMLLNCLIENIVCVGGFQDQELVTQFKDYKPQLKMFKRYLLSNDYSCYDVEYFEELLSERIEFVTGSDLVKNQLKYKQRTNTLFIWEESHYAQDKINRPYKFLNSCDVSANGNEKKLEGDRNNYFLSVSATPFSEISDKTHENQQKKIVIMKPGHGYVSVERMYSTGHIIGIKKWDVSLVTAIKRQKSLPHPTYSLVRIRGDSMMVKAKEIATSQGIDYEVFDANERNETKKNKNEEKMQSIDDMKKQPLVPKIVFIRGMLRMGKVVPKEHISFVMETSKRMKADVLMQGLLGRTLGYHNNANVIAYVPNFVLENNEIENYILFMNGNMSNMPKTGHNLTRSKSNSDWFHALPIVIPPHQHHVDEEEYNDPDYEQYEIDKILKRCQSAIKNGSAINGNGIVKTEELQEQIQDIFQTKEYFNTCIRNIEKNNGAINETYKNMPQLLYDSITNKNYFDIPAGCGFETNDKAIINIWKITTDKFEEEFGFQKGSLILHGRTRRPDNEDEALKRNMPKTTKLEAFTNIDEDGEIVVRNGSYNIPVPVETCYDALCMRDIISKLIKLSTNEIMGDGAVLQFPNFISSNQSENNTWKGIVVKQNVLTALEKNGSIYRHIQQTHGLTLKIKKVQGRVPEEIKEAGLIRLSKIEWVK
jgi:hypothetical protein